VGTSVAFELAHLTRESPMSNLCKTFQSIARKTWARIGKGRRVQHQLLEDTLSDLACLQLKSKHPSEIITRTFNKVQEGVTGADWEWWLSDPSRRLWRGLRVQAKVLNVASGRFEQLHYVTRRGISQIDLLEADAARHRAVPLYALYLESPMLLVRKNPQGWPCLSYPFTPQLFGCAITSTSAVRSINRRDGLHDVIPFAHPWHCLVCCNGYGGGSLPERADHFLLERSLASREGSSVLDTAQLPLHVRRILDEPGRNEVDMDPPDARIGRVTLISDAAI
jgi:hypothetical protein